VLKQQNEKVAGFW